MTPEINIYELYEQIKREICAIDNLTPEQYEEQITQLAEELGI
jgi:hypothetical protein